MRIGMLAPPFLSVPPKGYGGTETIVSLLTEGLVSQGHDVTLFASGDSQTKARLSSIFPNALGLDGNKLGNVYLPLLHYTECFRRASEFDLIHSHTQYLGLFLAQYCTTPVVHTWHGTFHAGEVPEDNRKVLTSFKNQHFISISDSQREGLPELNYLATVYNGIEMGAYPFVAKSAADYLLWIGRVTPKKGPLEAIQVAKILKRKLILAASVEPVNQAYFNDVIKPEIDGEQITLEGELDKVRISSLYAGAVCTLYPISWHEPFGLVMAESMACGTPVVAYNIGAVREVIKNGETGFVVESATGIDGLAHAVGRIGEIDRVTCRNHVEKNFTAERMVTLYEQAYRGLLNL